MSATATLAPPSAIASAVARPIPAPAPVTSTTLSCKIGINPSASASVCRVGQPILHGYSRNERPVVPANIPATQTVIEIKAPGGPEMLVPATRPVPEPKAGEVLIRIAASGVNRADCLQRMGRYPMPPGAPDIPGLECSGTVVKIGEGVTRWRVGDELCALMSGDGYSEYAAVPVVQCLPVPAGVGLVDAGGLPETFCTVWTNVFERMRLQPGEVFLVQGGSSGIGVTAIQLAKAFGAKVLTTAGSDEKCRVCREFGADVAINYR